jgi:hypothetical protein
MPILTRNNEFSHLQHEKTMQQITKASCVPMEEEKIEKKNKKEWHAKACMCFTS